MYSLGGWVLRSGSLRMVVVVVVVTVVTDVSTTFMYGLSNDRCDGSSSKNECNREFDLNHFLVMKCGGKGLTFSVQCKSCVVRCGGMRPAEETGYIEAKFL